MSDDASKSKARPRGYVIFCDDIRQEVGGKYNYIGVYSDEMLIEARKWPIILPKFGIIHKIVIPMAYEYGSFFCSLSARYESGKDAEVFRSEALGRERFPAGTAEGREKQAFFLTMNGLISPLPLEGPCRLVSKARFDDADITLGQLNVRLNAGAAGGRPERQPAG